MQLELKAQSQELSKTHAQLEADMRLLEVARVEAQIKAEERERVLAAKELKLCALAKGARRVRAPYPSNPRRHECENPKAGVTSPSCRF